MTNEMATTHEMDDAVDRLRADYDETPYTSNSFPQSAPGQLAAIAHLFGLDAPDVSSSRVLEIGCAGGGNLIPFAAAHPRARVVGIDLSQVQIEQGRARVAALGLDNLELIAGDVAQMDLAALGRFDFIVAHGVYSWVPAAIQDALLSAFRGSLAPDGVCYVSYNTYPGWKSKEVLRDAMLLASGTSETPTDKVRAARGMVDFLEQVVPADGVMRRVLEVSQDHALGFGDSYLLHDELATFNSPCYFYEMVGRAGAHGLAYLAEAHLETMIPANFGPKVDEYLRATCGGVQVLVEQYLDFVLNRMFRESLLVHVERAPQIRYDPQPGRAERVHIAAWVPPVDGQTRLDNSRQEYLVSDGATLFTNDPGLKATMDSLNARWPATVSRHDLVAEAQARLESAGFTVSSNLAEHVDNLMLVLILQGVAKFRLDPVSLEPASEPLRLAEETRRTVEVTRERGDASTFNLWHETLILSALDSLLLPLLDGTRDSKSVVEALVASVREQPIEIELDGKQVTGESDVRAALAKYVAALPQHLAELQLVRPV